MEEEHEKFLELLLAYYNCRQDWLGNNTKERGIAMRKILKQLRDQCKVMLDTVLELQHERREENLRIFKEKGFVPRKAKPRR